ncbi:hypothetical protein WN944_007319 [Citrus x changshan-huyou]|uniref:Uncharacterized protein n=1 Tax=Citrus x changshan-huyou TaxID=2935761 RepID=A0AAP0MKT2_9ROSI
MPEDLEKPLVDPKNFNREGIDVASSACNKCNTVTAFVISNFIASIVSQTRYFRRNGKLENKTIRTHISKLSPNSIIGVLRK